MMDEIYKKPPLAECAFGWGKMFRLYPDYLDINGTHYPLDELTHVHPVYQHVMGISSVRLELSFAKQQVVLRGIAALGEAQKALEYLNSHLLAGDDAQNGEGAAHQAAWTTAEQQFEPEQASQGDLYLREQAQAPTAKIAAPNWQRFRQDQRERRLKRIQIARSLREYGFDVDKLAQRLNEDALPDISVPVRLLPGEHAHYSADATLCGEPVGNALRYVYPARDHGTLILTNKRLVYIGRTSQIVLDYRRLSHVSRLRGAIALQADHWYRREIFEVRRALECIMHLESILKRFQRQQEFEAITNGYFREEQGVETTTPFATTAQTTHSPDE
jgi:hypothetical protein